MLLSRRWICLLEIDERQLKKPLHKSATRVIVE